MDIQFGTLIFQVIMLFIFVVLPISLLVFLIRKPFRKRDNKIELLEKRIEKLENEMKNGQ
ncbi:hypothetical protein DFP93_10494 [Aneurinibacillus soli]|uniref:Uncharacterized protein n=1 Tax=Aneurinibacillus soli TaxID=1500254 RepID=A0A0U5AXP2_9BACL|nr:hypothetical protein [Aneurinibacillus soli]PYE62447.1 hypothetical protein DFP93_10494 [Aneurinibacillus soli]BAU27010.1 hypothetical protein CB4_01179 [Aneurinibacillus soli]